MQMKFYQTLSHVCILHRIDHKKSKNFPLCQTNPLSEKDILLFKKDSHKVGVMKLSQFDFAGDVRQQPDLH